MPKSELLLCSVLLTKILTILIIYLICLNMSDRQTSTKQAVVYDEDSDTRDETGFGMYNIELSEIHKQNNIDQLQRNQAKQNWASIKHLFSQLNCWLESFVQMRKKINPYHQSWRPVKRLFFSHPNYEFFCFLKCFRFIFINREKENT